MLLTSLAKRPRTLLIGAGILRIKDLEQAQELLLNHNLFSEFAEFSTRRKDGPFDAVAAFARAAQVFVLIAGLLGAGAAAYGKHLDQSGTTEVDAKVVKFPSGYLK